MSEVSLSTIPDPRSPPSAKSSFDGHPSPHHPDLSDEVAALSNKLINAINYQTNLDDTLAATRHDLATANERIRQLEADNRKYESRIKDGDLLTPDAVESRLGEMTSMLAEEKQQRGSVEKEKKGIEQELESLTAALFEEANKVLFHCIHSMRCLLT